jgi:hypothetical protein
MKQVLGIQVQAIRLSETTTGTAVDRRIAATASRLGATTPASRQARIAGVLGMIRHSTCGFSIRLESGEEVHGVMESDEGLSMMPGLFGKPVLVLGSAIYRPSGRLLRIDAVGIEDGKDAPRLFAKIPQPQATRRPVPARLKVSETGKRGVPAFFGIWPGDESDADMTRLVKQIRADVDLAN